MEKRGRERKQKEREKDIHDTHIIPYTSRYTSVQQRVNELETGWAVGRHEIGQEYGGP